MEGGWGAWVGGGGGGGLKKEEFEISCGTI